MTAPAVGELLRGFRAAAALTREALAEKAELSVEAIRALEYGRRRYPRPETLSRLANALALPDSERLRLEDSARRPSSRGRSTELPDEIVDLVGRDKVAAEVAAALTGTPTTPGGLIVVSIAGMGGIGKTALAVRVARGLTDTFPDGALYLKLRGQGDGGPVDPKEALRRVLRSFGTPLGDLPDDVSLAAARYRAILAERRMLVLLDDAAGGAQVKPLLPGAGGSVALITSRRRLSGLPGAKHVQLDLLAEDDALELLGTALEPGRIESEPVAAREIVRLCGRLPLALQVAGTYLADRPDLELARTASALADDRSKFEVLSSGEAGVRRSLKLSVDALAGGDRPVERAAARALPLLSVLEGDDFSLRMGSAALGLPLPEAEAALEHLVDVSLLQTTRLHRYQLHDLVRAVGRDLADEQSRQSAWRRVLDQYLALLWRADELTYPGLLSEGWRDASWSEPAKDVPDFEAAVDLLDADRSGLLLAAAAAAQGGSSERETVVRMAAGMNQMARDRKRWIEWRDLNQLAAGALDDSADPVAVAMIHYDLGLAHNELGAFAAGAKELRRVLELAPLIGNTEFESNILIQLSHALEQSDQLVEARAIAQRALELKVRIEDDGGVSWSQLVLGMIAGKEGDLAAQQSSFAAAIRLLRQFDRPLPIATQQQVIGASYRDAGQYDQALAALQESLLIYSEADRSNGMAESLDDLGSVWLELGRFDEALESLREALALAVETEQWDREASVRTTTGRVHAALGDQVAAEREWRIAHRLRTSHGVDATRVEALLHSLPETERPPASE